MHKAEQLIHSYHGNGGRRSLYSLCKELDIDLNLAYVILASPQDAMLAKIRSGKKIHYYKEGQENIKFKRRKVGSGIT